MSRFLPITITLVLLGPAPARADTPTALQTQQAAAQDQKVTYVAPETPAFTFLGITPTTVTRPTTPRDLGTTLLDGIDASGRVVRGFALEMTPSFLFPNLTPRDPVKNRVLYGLASTGVSLGTIQAAGDTSATDMAVGFRINLYDAGDPMWNKAFQDSLKGILDAARPATPDEDNSIREKAVGGALRDLRARWVKTHWNASRLAGGLGTGMRLIGSRFSSEHFLGASAWLVGSYGVGAHGQLLAQVQFDDRAAIAEAPDSTRWTYGVRAVVGSPTVNGFAEVVGYSTAKSGYVRGSTRQSKWTAGLEFLLADGFWLSTGVGSSGASSGGSDHAVILANLRWVFSNAPRYTP